MPQMACPHCEGTGFVEKENVIKWGGWELSTHVLKWNGGMVRLTTSEAIIVRKLLMAKGDIVKTPTLLTVLYSEETYGKEVIDEEGCLRAFVHRIRKKLGREYFPIGYYGYHILERKSK